MPDVPETDLPETQPIRKEDVFLNVSRSAIEAYFFSRQLDGGFCLDESEFVNEIAVQLKKILEEKLQDFVTLSLPEIIHDIAYEQAEQASQDCEDY